MSFTELGTNQAVYPLVPSPKNSSSLLHPRRSYFELPFRPTQQHRLANMNVRYDPVSSDMNAPFSLSSPPHADDTSPSAPFLPPLPAMPTLPTLPTLPALPTLPKLPPLPEMPTFAPLKIRHAHRVYITLQALIYTFLFYLCIPIWGDKNSTLFAWLALGIVRYPSASCDFVHD
jgi:hypothetical protein